MLSILFNVVNSIIKHCYTQLQAGFRLNNLFSVVDNIEQCRQHNIVQACPQQRSTTQFLRVYKQCCKLILKKLILNVVGIQYFEQLAQIMSLMMIYTLGIEMKEKHEPQVSVFLRIPKVEQQAMCMEHAFLHGKPFSNCFIK